MASTNVETVRTIHAAFNDRDWDLMQSKIAEGCQWVDGQMTTHKGPEEFATHYSKAWADAFSDGKVTNARYYDAGDTVVAEFVGTGTHDGPLGPMPASGKHLDLPYIEVYHFDGDGKVSGGAAYMDGYGMMVQLGFAEPM
jgi:steroid delta-isomerase-like uncharacterized protein